MQQSRIANGARSIVDFLQVAMPIAQKGGQESSIECITGANRVLNTNNRWRCALQKPVAGKQCRFTRALSQHEDTLTLLLMGYARGALSIRGEFKCREVLITGLDGSA